MFILRPDYYLELRDEWEAEVVIYPMPNSEATNAVCQKARTI